MRSDKGITMVSLVITIIILLILSSITIGMLTSDNGVIKRATQAKEESEVAEIKERIIVDIRQAEGESTTGELTTTQFSTILNKYFSDVPDTLPTNISESDLELTTKEGNYKIKLSDVYDEELSE